MSFVILPQTKLKKSSLLCWFLKMGQFGKRLKIQEPERSICQQSCWHKSCFNFRIVVVSKKGDLLSMKGLGKNPDGPPDVTFQTSSPAMFPAPPVGTTTSSSGSWPLSLTCSTPLSSRYACMKCASWIITREMFTELRLMRLLDWTNSWSANRRRTAWSMSSELPSAAEAKLLAQATLEATRRKEKDNVWLVLLHLQTRGCCPPGRRSCASLGQEWCVHGGKPQWCPTHWHP